MKKFIFTLMLVTLSFGAYAQKGMQGVGLSLNFGIMEENHSTIYPITTLKYQYYIHDNIRLVPSLTLGCTNINYDNTFSYYVNPNPYSYYVNPYLQTDFFLCQIKKFRPYLSVALGCSIAETLDVTKTYAASAFNLKCGMGMEWRVAYNWTIQCSGNFSLDVGGFDAIGAFASIGFVYNF